MPEGDTLFRVAYQIRTQICGKRIEAARGRPELSRAPELAGHCLDTAEARIIEGDSLDLGVVLLELDIPDLEHTSKLTVPLMAEFLKASSGEEFGNPLSAHLAFESLDKAGSIAADSIPTFEVVVTGLKDEGEEHDLGNQIYKVKRLLADLKFVRQCVQDCFEELAADETSPLAKQAKVSLANIENK